MRLVRIWGLFCLLILTLVVQASPPVRFGALLADSGQPPAAIAALDLAAKTGISRVRIDATWPRIQPRPGVWEFAWLDTMVAAAEVRKLDVVLVLGPAPTWTISYLNNPTAEEAGRARPDLPKYAAYVTRVAERYQSRVRLYQVWDRPSGNYLLATPAHVYEMFRTAARSIHAVHPELQVVVAEPADLDLSWVAAYLQQARGEERADILLLSPVRHTLAPETFAWRLHTLTERVLPRTDAPLLWVDIPLSVAQAPTQFALAAAALVQGVSQVHFVPDGAATLAHPQLAAGLRTLTRLSGYSYRGWTPIAPLADGAIFTRDAASTLLALPYGDATLTLEPANACTEGGSITVHPVGAEVHTLTLQAPLALPLEMRPTLVEGVCAPTEPQMTVRPPATVPQEAVSLDMTGTDMLGIRPLRQLPCGNYRLLNVQGTDALGTVREVAPWIYFDIPDGFLYYNTEQIPVEVTVRVFGVTKKGKTGFNLYYDGLKGMTYTPWQWIDVGAGQIFTYTVVLRDAIFANREGYDLRLQMGGSEESVRVVDVMVKKLR